MKKKRKLILIIVSIILIVLLALLGIATTYKKKVENNKQDIVVNGQSLASIINDLGSIFIKQQPSEENGFSKDIYIKFKYNLYENGESKEKIYLNLINNIEKYIQSNVRLIDESRDIIIRVNYSKDDDYYYYTINGEEDYFKKHNSINTLNKNNKKNNNKEEIDLTVNSNFLKDIIKNDWSADSIDINEEYNTVNNYDEYFYEGIKIKKVMSKVFNIRFTNRYQHNVINGIKVGTSISDVIETLGEPTYQSENVIGYKNNSFYVFFSEDEISIFRVQKYDTEEFTELLEDYINNEINLKEFMNKLTYLWDDYSEYTYTASNLNIVYPLQGLKINMTSNNDTLGIQIYDNFDITPKIEKLIQDGKITAKFDKNIYFEEELNTLRLRDDLIYSAQLGRYVDNNPSNELKNQRFSELYWDVCKYNSNNDISSLIFLSINEDLPDIELNEDIYTYIWLNDYSIFYSIKNKGIYFYDLKTKEKRELITGDDDFYIKSYNNHILKYDEEIVEIDEE